MKKQIFEKTFKDPVCGMEVCRTTAVVEWEHEGKTYYFCARICKEAFEANPEKYMSQHRQHGVNSK
tara:strand:+ start:158 stop:355 length:198 start_codon:yes stop_codon:yes gene_type:complete